VVYGSAHGLDLATRKVFTQASPGIRGVPEAGDHFGSRLTAGDLDGDGRTDLVVDTVVKPQVTAGTLATLRMESDEPGVRVV